MSPAIPCEEAVSQLWRYLDSELDDVERGVIEAHLAFCLRCCGELEFARELRGVLATAAEADVPTDVEHRLQAFIDTLDVPGDGEPTTQAT